jgi:hypothetical protein
MLEKGIDFYVAEMHAPVRVFSQLTGLLEMIGEDHLFLTIDAAVRFIEMSDSAEKANPIG